MMENRNNMAPLHAMALSSACPRTFACAVPSAHTLLPQLLMRLIPCVLGCSSNVTSSERPSWTAYLKETSSCFIFPEVLIAM